MKALIQLILNIIFIFKLIHGYSIVVPAKFCEFNSANPTCDASAKYRTSNGFCNNLFNPKWGAEHDVYDRLLKARYQDGISKVVESVKGGPLPSARTLSLKLFSNQNITSNLYTMMLPEFGVLTSADVILNANLQIPRRCCFENGTLPPGPLDPMCMNIPIDSSDPTYAEQPRQCIKFIRAPTDLNSNCSGFNKAGPASPVNSVSSYIDLSDLYGSNDEDQKLIRTFNDGLLKVRMVRGEEFPLLVTKETAGYLGDGIVGRFYLLGDTRANLTPLSIAFVNIMIREHNRVARELKRLNPQWNDEKLFQETRRILIAQVQYITYYHFFTELLGKWYMQKNLLIFHDNGDKTVNDYDPNVSANMNIEYSTAAIKFYHTMVTGVRNLVSEKDEKVVGTFNIRDTLFQPWLAETENSADDALRGLCRQPAGGIDRNIDDDLKEFMFRSVTKYAQDYKAAEIQRGRDHGLGSYNDAREYCGLPRATTWTGFSDEIPQADIDRMRLVYKHPDDVELTVGGALERIVADAACGKTYQCIMAKQLYNSRVGDRFWFETSDPLLKFTSEQLKEIRKTSLARILCNNAKTITRMQRNVFRLPSNENPIVGCNFIPMMNLRPWKEI